MSDAVQNDDLAETMRAQSPWLLPSAIIFAGLLLAVAVYVVRTHETGAVHTDTALLAPVTPADHIVGSPTAPIIFVEYSDIDSSYSKDFQASLEQLMTQYGAGGKVAWVYRHFPLIDQHPNAEEHAEAAECAAFIGGEDLFWRFIDAVQAQAPGDSQFDPQDYPAVVSQLGLDSAKFDACLSNHTFAKRVGAEFNNAMTIGADGAPFTVLLVQGQPPETISGAVPYQTLQQIVQLSLQKVASAPATQKGATN